MTREEQLLTCLAEECAEVIQRISKQLRFGTDEQQEGQALNNIQRTTEELFDLTAVATICEREGLLLGVMPNEAAIQRKLAKIEKFFAISRAQGTLSEALSPSLKGN